MRNSPQAALLAALAFAAEKHKHQRRKGSDSPPFINHAIEVADILARLGGVDDPITLQAGVLHDTLEDTDTTGDELEQHFGAEVRAIVEEVTDNTKLPRAERRAEQESRARKLSERARLVRIADKIANVGSVGRTPPQEWSVERRQEYLEWTQRVVEGCRGCSPQLDRLYDACLAESYRLVGEADEASPAS